MPLHLAIQTEAWKVSIHLHEWDHRKILTALNTHECEHKLSGLSLFYEEEMRAVARDKSSIFETRAHLVNR